MGHPVSLSKCIFSEGNVLNWVREYVYRIKPRNMEQKKWSEREGWKSECVVPNRKIYSEQFCGKIEDDWSCLGFLKEEIAAELAIGSNLQIWFSISTRKRNKEKVNHRGEFYSMKGEILCI